MPEAVVPSSLALGELLQEQPSLDVPVIREKVVADSNCLAQFQTPNDLDSRFPFF